MVFSECAGRLGALAVMAVVAVLAVATRAHGQAREERVRIPGDPSSIELLLHHVPPADGAPAREGRVVLFVHGATFPSALAAAYRFDGHSWMDDLSLAGFDVWALDFPGYGGSDGYPAMAGPADAHPPLGRAPEASRHLARAVEYVVERAGVERVSIVAHSWGTIVAGLYAGAVPERLDRLVLFGPVAVRRGPARSREREPAYHYATIADQWEKFAASLPEGESPRISAAEFERWSRLYLESDPTSRTRTPPSVKVPYGPVADLLDAWSGRLAYDPAKIVAPTLIVRGEWDPVIPDAEARWLFDALRSAPVKRDVVISRGTHVMHLEESRYQLYREVQLFLEGRDTPASGHPARRAAAASTAPSGRRGATGGSR
ncbi:MAG TPA: alpha/beta fold hydrolase [Longimicrobiales bacterium]